MSDPDGTDPDSTDPEGRTRLTAHVHGHVQGVGFRWWTRSRALERGLTGYAANQPDGRVLVVAEGSDGDVRSLLAALRSGDTPGRVDRVVERFEPARGDLTGFVER